MLDPRQIAPDTLRPIRRIEYDVLVESGFLEDERVELLEGVIVRMTPHGPSHDSTIDRLNELLVVALRGRARVRVQGAFAASDTSEPEPDIAVLPPGDYDEGHPDQAWLIIEVAESSLTKDRGPKAALYARSGVEEYWIVNLLDAVIEVFTHPREDGYQQVEACTREDVIRLRHFPDVTIAVSDVLRRLPR